MVKIISDSTCDLSQEVLERYDIDIIPLHIVKGDEELEDGPQIDIHALYEWADKNKTTPKTSVGGGDVTGRGAHHSNGLAFKILERLDLQALVREDELMGQEVRMGEIHGLFAFFRNRDAGHHNIAVTRFKTGENAAPGCVDEFHFKAAVFGDFLHQVDVKTDKLLVRRFKFKRTVGRPRTDNVRCGSLCQRCRKGACHQGSRH